MEKMSSSSNLPTSSTTSFANNVRAASIFSSSSLLLSSNPCPMLQPVRMSGPLSFPCYVLCWDPS